ncbi:trans-sulfuration enzyme family protein [Galbibacter mesophilus]|uniref:trans-sulfuration enzyme family protein n=1 Tax=Galbibacter mesophilus TaxID=379069 RepID=UPI00191E99FB|nr:PLP-dependent aspartate aminotransferase family protein [Galbibacter mesophilus]MCM5663603.1 PLP-dependent aspartate aminotransferase family protein [Galbibacter mesophilus]
MNSKNLMLNTICTHLGEVKDNQYKGAVSPIYTATSYAYENVDVKRYPRYFNTPNQIGLAKKLAALEHAESALIFGSGMAAVSTSLLAFLKAGDHVVLQKVLYGGTYNFVVEELKRFGIDFSFTEGLSEKDFEEKIKPNTKVIFIETPSNPLLSITDLTMIAKLAKTNQLITMIDNTFASPVNQNPIDFGIDVVIHSATKYLGGHSDILAGAVCSSEENIEKIFSLGKNLGGSLSDYTVWLLERSIKTLGIRVKAQNRNAKKLAKYFSKNEAIDTVYYPGLKTHPDYELAKEQMRGFGGMISFELKSDIDSVEFVNSLEIIKPSMSLAGVESTIVSPAKTSHALLSQEERKKQGISENLLRLSVGIEDKRDLIADFEQAVSKVKAKSILI